MADRTGQRLGNYDLVRLLGRGGFAEVYLGKHVRLETQAAIKVLYTQFEGNDTEYFLQEARTVARLIHPHIVRIFDFDVQDGVPFLVMDYALNGTLRQRHPKGSRVPLEAVVSYVGQVADALQYAHDEKLIHRDMKPENMLVGRRNDILLTDFGIALIAQSTRMQSTQEVVGTAYYMAPEQLQGKPRIASDQYALGVVVYEWLTGERPFHGSFSEIASQHMFVPPPSMRDKLPSISPSVEEVVMTALAKDPHQRFGSIRALATALEQASQAATATVIPSDFPPTIVAAPFVPPVLPEQADPAHAPVLTPPAPVLTPSGSEPITLPPTELGALSSAMTPPKTAIQPGKRLYTYHGHTDWVNSVAWSPDGTKIASGSRDRTVRVWDAATGRTLLFFDLHKAEVTTVAWSPDGTRVASGGKNRTLKVWETVPHGNVVTCGDDYLDRINGVAWSPDGTQIASGSRDRTVRVWDAATGRKFLFFDLHKAEVTTVAWSPDGTRIASGSADETIQIWEVIPHGSVVVCRDTEMDKITGVAWSPDGTRIVSGHINWAVGVWDARTGSILSLFDRHKAAVNAVAWSPDGKLIASAARDGYVRLWEPKRNGEVIKYQGFSAFPTALAWSPLGNQIAVACTDGTVQVWETA